MDQVSEGVMRKLAKIKALKESAEAIGSEGEAMAAAAMLNELLMKHKLEISDIDYELEIKEEPVDTFSVGGGVFYKDGKAYYKEYPEVEVRSKRLDWSERLAKIVVKAHGCTHLVEPGSSRLYFVGRKSNVAIAEYIYITMFRTIEKLSWKEYKTKRNKTKWEQIKHYPKAQQSQVEVDYYELEGYRASWIAGFIARLAEMFREIDERRAAEATTGTALMRIDKDKQAVALYMEDNSEPVGGLNGGGSNNGSGYRDGKNKANQVGITAAGLGTSGGPKGHLN